MHTTYVQVISYYGTESKLELGTNVVHALYQQAVVTMGTLEELSPGLTTENPYKVGWAVAQLVEYLHSTHKTLLHP